MDFLNKQATIVRILWTKTQGNEIKWGASEDDPDKYETHLGNKTISISYEHYHDESGDPTMDSVITIMDGSGGVSRTIRDTTLSPVPVKMVGYSGWFALMGALYDAAQIQASGAHEVVDDVLRLLGFDDDSL